MSVAVELAQARDGWLVLGDALAACAEAGLWPVLVDDRLRVLPLARDAGARRIEPPAKLAGEWVSVLRERSGDVRRLLLDSPTLLDELRQVDPDAWECFCERAAIVESECRVPRTVADCVALAWVLPTMTAGQLKRVMPLGLLSIRTAYAQA